MKVEFTNKYFSAKDPQRTVTFTAKQRDAETLIAALSAFYSGDPYSCKIDGKRAPLDRDLGLKTPTATKEE